MSSKRRRYEKLMRTIEWISRENLAGAVVIVEGMHDRAALRRLGLKGRILTFKSSERC